ncbi:MAG: hypothetical protein ACL7BU_11375 [Candidatus Phlomobacter fragariae]
MKTKAMLFASVLLIGCQMTPNKQTPDPSSANQDIETTAWESTYLIENDLWSYISNELKMDIPDNARIANQILFNQRKPSPECGITCGALHVLDC